MIGALSFWYDRFSFRNDRSSDVSIWWNDCLFDMMTRRLSLWNERRFLTLPLAIKMTDISLSYERESITLTSFQKDSHIKQWALFLLTEKRVNFEKKVLAKTLELLSFQKECHFYRFILMGLLERKWMKKWIKRGLKLILMQILP